MKHNWEMTASLHRVMLCNQNISPPLLALSHSKEHGSGCSKIWQVYFHLRQLALAVTTLSVLLQRFLFSVSHLCLTVFHYFERNICHGFWKLLLFISARVSWCTATFLCCWFQCKCYTCVKVKSLSITVLPNIPFLNCPKYHLMQEYKLILLYIAFFSKLKCFHWAYFMFAISLCAISRLIEWVLQNTTNKPKQVSNTWWLLSLAQTT